MRFLWIVFFVAAAFVALAIIIPLLHVALAVAIVVAGAMFLMAVWKAMFGPPRAMNSNGGHPPLNP